MSRRLTLGCQGCYELARRIRGRPGPPPYLIALTGYGRPEDRAEATRAGFDAHLTKRFRLTDLRRLLATVPAAESGSGTAQAPRTGASLMAVGNPG